MVRRLLDILPVKVIPPGRSQQQQQQRRRKQQGPGGAVNGNEGGAIEEERALVMICGQLLPDSRDNISELVQLLPVGVGT